MSSRFLLFPLSNSVGKKMVERWLYFAIRNNYILLKMCIYAHAIIKYTTEVLLGKFIFCPFSHFFQPSASG